MRWQWWFFSNTNNQALWSPGPWSSCSLPRGLPCGEGCLLFNLTSKRSLTSSFYHQILLTSSINFRCALPISLLLSWISALAPSFRLSRDEDTSSRYNWIQCGLFFGAFQHFSFSPITVLPCGLQSAFLCPLLLVTMVGDFIQLWFTILKTQSHTFTIMMALVQQQFEVPKLILIVISVVE